MFQLTNYFNDDRTTHTKQLSNLGVVLAIGDGIARVAGLPQIKAGEMVYIFGAKKSSRISLKLGNGTNWGCFVWERSLYSSRGSCSSNSTNC
jgi:F0F1-type ATP synthase alpha subunit